MLELYLTLFSKHLTTGIFRKYIFLRYRLSDKGSFLSPLAFHTHTAICLHIIYTLCIYVFGWVVCVVEMAFGK